MRKEASVYLGIFSVSSIKNTFNKLFFLRMVKKPFGGSSWLLIILDFYDFIFALLVWGGAVHGGAANIFGFFGGWVGVLQLVFLLLPQGLCLEMGVPDLGWRGRRVLGQAFRVT